MSKDYNSVDIVGTVMSPPNENKTGYSFYLQHEGKDKSYVFFVAVRTEEPADFFEGDRVFITKAGFFMHEGKNCLAVIEGSNIEVIRRRCNLGTEKI